ncbi:hypothetical protein Q7P35_001241 [Cladosporium inversicolor]
MAARKDPLPAFVNLPLNENDPPNSAWGLWNDSKDASLGSLNYLTDDVVLKTTREEVKTGERVGLDLPLDFFKPPLLGRAAFEQRVIDKSPFVVNDDIISFNTQGSSQWDSLRHFAYQQQRRFYNGATQEDIHSTSQTAVNGLQPWTKRGLMGRGVLIDFASYAERNGIHISHFGGSAITLDQVLAIAAEQKLELHTGDILFLRTGFTTAYKTLDEDQRHDVASRKEWCGLGQSQETTEWLWKRQFAAVASDSPGFEVKPPVEKAWHLHPILLAGWGTPIGELFDLDELAKLFASPPNAIAVL